MYLFLLQLKAVADSSVIFRILFCLFAKSILLFRDFPWPLLEQGPSAIYYKAPWTGLAVSHFILDMELSTSPELRYSQVFQILNISDTWKVFVHLPLWVCHLWQGLRKKDCMARTGRSYAVYSAGPCLNSMTFQAWKLK